MAAKDKLESTDVAAIYVIAAELPDGSFVVKIGMTSVPYERYATLITAIPFPSAMKWSWVGMRSAAFVVETKLHQLFASRNTAREWFHFRREEKQVLWDGVSAAFFACREQLPEWRSITEEQVSAYTQSKAKPRPKKAPRGVLEFDYRNRLARHERIF